MKTHIKTVGAVERERERGSFRGKKGFCLLCKNNEYGGKFYTLVV